MKARAVTHCEAPPSAGANNCLGSSFQLLRRFKVALGAEFASLLGAAALRALLLLL